MKYPKLAVTALLLVAGIMFLPKVAWAADRYWIGGTGNWSDTAHWSLTSGGAGGASVPDINTNCRFDSNSFSSASQTVTIDSTASCANIDWTGATNNPTFTFSAALNVSGSLTFISAMTITGGSLNITFNSATTNTVTTAGKTISTVILKGGGTWNLQDNLTTAGNLAVENGTLNTNSHDLSVFGIGDGHLTSAPEQPVNANFASSTLTVSSTMIFQRGQSNLDLDQATIIPNGTNIQIALHDNIEIYRVLASPTSNGQNFGLFYQFYVKNLTLEPDASYNVSNLKTDHITANGSAGHLVTIQGYIGGTNQVSLDYISISGSQCTLVKPCYAGTHSTDGGGNTDWIFTAPPPPTVTSVTGNNPALSSSTPSITINGSGFAPTPTVTIGGTAATGVTYVNATQLTATGPAKGVGIYDVVVTNPDTRTGTCTNCMEYGQNSSHSLYYNGAINTSWDTTGNWWQDQAYTIPIFSLPTTTDNAYIDIGMNTGPSATTTIANLLVSQTTDNAYFSGNLTVTGTSTFGLAGTHFGYNNGGNITGNAVFYAGSYNSGTILGDAIFNDSSSNQTTVSGNAIFNNSASNAGTVGGIAKFTYASGGAITIADGSSWGGTAASFVGNDDLPISNWTFNGNSYNQGILSGDATFNNTSGNGNEIEGDAVFNGNSANNATVDGNATFNLYSMNWGTIHGNATFSCFSLNFGTVDGDVTQEPCDLPQHNFRGTQTLYGIDGGGSNPNPPHLFTISPDTSEILTNIGPVGFNITGLAFNPLTHELYGTTGGNDVTGGHSRSLIKIDPITGAGTWLGLLENDDFSGIVFPDIAFRSDGRLYGFGNFRSESNLFLIDPSSCDGDSDTSCLATVVGESGLFSQFGNALAFDSNDNLYFFGEGDDGPFYKLDPDTGATLEEIDIANPSSEDYALGAASFDGDDNLYVTRTNYGDPPAGLVNIDVSSGIITPRGTNDSMVYVEAIAFLFEPAPAAPAEEEHRTPSGRRSSAANAAGHGVPYAPGISFNPLANIPFAPGITPLDTLGVNQPGTLPPTSASFTKDLQSGMSDPQIKLLQQYLNSHGYILAASGPGSPGQETTKFGALTRAALIKFQKANNITPSVGYFGPKTRSAILNNQ